MFLLPVYDSCCHHMTLAASIPGASTCWHQDYCSQPVLSGCGGDKTYQQKKYSSPDGCMELWIMWMMIWAS